MSDPVTEPSIAAPGPTPPRGPTLPASERMDFLLRRLHSLTGIVPLGIFLVEHLWTNAQALGGRATYDDAVARLHALPGLHVLEFVGIFLPLAFHAVFGLLLAGRTRYNLRTYGFDRNWYFVLQRVTGVVVLLFLVGHLLHFRIPVAMGRLSWGDFYARLVADLDATPYLAAYVVGLTATVFHFANGLWAGLQTWGVVTTARGMRRAAVLCIALGLVLWVVGTDTLFHFAWRCGGVLPLPHDVRTGACGPMR